MYFTRGRITRQAHVDVPDGTFEEEFGREGFFGRSSHLYRTEAPVCWTTLDGDCRPELLDTRALDDRPGGDGATGTTACGKADWWKARTALLFNDDVVISVASLTEPMSDTLFRNADGDELLFVHEGSGTIETDFGPLTYRKGHYMLIPRGTAYRLLPTERSRFLITETRGELTLPERGLLGRHALFDPDVIDVPEPAASTATNGQRAWTLLIKRRGRITRATYPFDPLNTVGWKGDLTVWRLHIDDIRPITSERYHLPPSAHATFVAPNVVVCTFLPRPLENGDPGALKVPFYHSNIDYDEVLFYHDGGFFSRGGIKPGMLSFHPQGIHHGPHPKAIENTAQRERTDEQAVMIDTRHPLELTEAGRAIADPEYWRSWSTDETDFTTD